MITCFVYQKNNVEQVDFSKLKHAADFKKAKAKVWVVIKNPSLDEINLLQEKFEIHPTTLEDLSTPRTRIKYEEFDNDTVIVFKGVQEMRSSMVIFYTLFFVDGDGYLITVYHAQDNDVIGGLMGNHKKIKQLMSKGEDYLLHYILDKEVDKYLNLREKFSEELKSIEKGFVKMPTKEIFKELFIKELALIEIKQRIDSITDVCARLTKPTENFIQNELIPYFRDVYDHSIKVSEAMKTQLNRINGIRSSYLSLISNRTNETMRTLTILMAVMMPMTVITGFYGMNVLLPIQQNHYAYAVLIALMIFIGLVMLYIFRKLGWMGDSGSSL